MKMESIIKGWFPQPSELVSISGNIARKEDGSSFTHIHACWAEDDGTVFAGHMFSWLKL